MKISSISVLKNQFGFSAIIDIDEKFVISLGFDSIFSIPNSNEACSLNPSDQEDAQKTLNVSDIVSDLKIPNSIEGLIALGAKVY